MDGWMNEGLIQGVNGSLNRGITCGGDELNSSPRLSHTHLIMSLRTVDEDSLTESSQTSRDVPSTDGAEHKPQEKQQQQQRQEEEEDGGSKVANPASRRQLQQLFQDPEFRRMKEQFCRVILTLLKFRRAPGCARQLISATEAAVAEGGDDRAIYDRLHTLVHGTLFRSEEYQRAERTRGDFSREKNRTQQLEPILRRFLAARTGRIQSFLDVGCNEGNITAAVGELLGAQKIHGCDVFRARDTYDDFEFTLLDPEDPYRFPYPDKSQDVVTAFMSLHHIEHVDRTLDEIHRVLRDDGIFLIREHDCDPPELSLLLDLMHGFYAMVWAEPREMEDFSVHYSNYRSRDQVTAVIEGSHDDASAASAARKQRFQSVFQGAAYGAWRHYYAVFIKGDAEEGFQEQAQAWFEGAPFPSRQQQQQQQQRHSRWGARRDRQPPAPSGRRLTVVLASEREPRGQQSWRSREGEVSGSYDSSNRRRRSRSRDRASHHSHHRWRRRRERRDSP